MKSQVRVIVLSLKGEEVLERFVAKIRAVLRGCFMGCQFRDSHWVFVPAGLTLRPAEGMGS